MHSFTSSQIETWERFYRANLINSLTGFKSLSLIGSKNLHGHTNLAIFSSIVHIGSNPALVGYINRPKAAAPHTLSNIEATEIYTLNHVSPAILNQAHQTSAKYPDSISEFKEVGLTEEYLHNISAPFVKESRVKYALSLQDIIPIKLNDTFLVIGKVIFINIEDDILLEDGFMQIEQAGSVCSNGGDAYYNTENITRLPYAKPGHIIPPK